MNCTGTRAGAALVIAGFLSGCVVYTVHNDFVRDAASKDMNCPKGKLKVTHYTNKPNKKTAEGCGERVHYVQVCPDKGKCTWQRDPRKPAQKLPAAAK